MLCPKCAQPNAEEARFCTSCGQSLTPVEPAAFQPNSALQPNVVQPVDPNSGQHQPWELTVSRDAQAAEQTVYGAAPHAAPTPDNTTQGIPTYSLPSHNNLPASQNQDVYYGAPPSNPNSMGNAPQFEGQQSPQGYNNMPAQPGSYAPPMVQQPPTAYGAPYGYAQPPMNPCRVCGTMIPPQMYACPRCGAPVGTIANPNDSTSTTYLPVGYQTPYAMVNTSGQKGAVPPEIEGMGWSWGGFGVNWIWCITHGMVGWGIGMLLLSMFCGIFALPAVIYLGVSGNKLAWQNRRYESIEHFKATERVWAKWGIGLFIASLLFLVVYVVAIIAMVSSSSFK